jgi:hypothetical protein
MLMESYIILISSLKIVTRKMITKLLPLGHIKNLQMYQVSFCSTVTRSYQPTNVTRSFNRMDCDDADWLGRCRILS